MTSLPRSPLAQPADAVRRRVLVAEDNEPLAELVAAVLAAAGYEVVVAHDGCRALAIVREQVFDALLTDWLMPCLSGDVLAERARLVDPTLPLLLMTAAQGAELLDLPWAAVLRKPFGVDVLVDAVNAATAVASAA